MYVASGLIVTEGYSPLTLQAASGGVVEAAEPEGV